MFSFWWSYIWYNKNIGMEHYWTEVNNLAKAEIYWKINMDIGFSKAAIAAGWLYI